MTGQIGTVGGWIDPSDGSLEPADYIVRRAIPMVRVKIDGGAPEL
jgi:hypothetical protein